VARVVAFLLLLGMFLIVGAPAFAASPWQNLASPEFVHADTRELPEAAVMTLAQDRAGFLWVGTQGGLARYDGYHFRNFLANASDPKALPDGYTRALLPDAGGGLWVGTSSNGLAHFDAQTETFRTWRPAAKQKGPRSASIDALVDSGDGGLWVGGDGGLDRFDPRTGTFVPFRFKGAQPVVWSLLIDRAGTLWAGTQDGLFYRPARANAFRAFPLTAAPQLTTPAIYSLYEDRAGRLWAGGVNALFVLDAKRHGARALQSAAADPGTLAPGQQWSIIEMTPGAIWAGTDSAISVVDAASLRVHRVAADLRNPGGLSGGRVLQFLRDRSGMVWLADHVGGLLEFNPGSRGLFQLSGTRPQIGFGEQGAPALVALPGDRLWVGGFDGRVARFQPETPEPLVVNLPNHAAVQTLVTAADGTLWIGTTGGLCRLRNDETQAVCPAQPSELATASIYALLPEGDRIWVGGSTGLFVEDAASGTVQPFPRRDPREHLSNNQVRALFRDRRGRLWIGTENGLNRIDRDGSIARILFAPADPNSIGPGGITSLFQDRRGRIWAGATGGPLNVLQENRDGTMRVRRLSLADGLPHENVDALAEDAQGRIWASTDKGIALIDPDTLRARGLGLADGVSDGAYWSGTVSQSPDGTIFFGGLEGITVVAPGASSAWTYAPPLVVSALHVGRRNVPAWSLNNRDAAVDLPPGARDVNVEFSALDYSAPYALRYQYKLDGYDREWIDADAHHRSATYTHLSPGDYSLDVRGTNRLGVWSRYVLRLRMNALPAWYETWWFRVLVAFLLLLAAYAAHVIRTGVLRRRQGELQTIVDDRTRELSEANVRLRELSLSDPLTGLRNRRFLTQHLEGDVARTLRRYEDWRADPSGRAPEDADVVFYIVDLDHFKVVNDRYGHHAGDQMLMQMRERLQEVFRESDFVVRWGGDEFLTVTREGRRSDAPPIAERIRVAVSGRPFTIGPGKAIPASVSVGFAAFPFVPSAPNAVTWLQVVGLADHALYMSKQAGRNTWFGLASSAATYPAMRARADITAEELVRSGAIEVISREATVPRPT
jgi:diguanylate cyclase (GGDEF)-like protein